MKFSHIFPIFALTCVYSAGCSSSEEEVKADSDLVYPREAEAKISQIFSTVDVSSVSARDALSAAQQAGWEIEYRDINFVRCPAKPNEIVSSGRILFGGSSERGPATIKFGVGKHDNFVCLEFFEPKN